MKSVDFLKYVWSFYGPEGLYPIKNITIVDVESATVEVLNRFGDDKFCGDSVDRERVRDVLLETLDFDDNVA